MKSIYGNMESVEYTSEQKRLMRLLDKCKNVNVFHYDGSMWLGDMVQACKDFCKSTTYPADFRVWLINNGYKMLS